MATEFSWGPKMDLTPHDDGPIDHMAQTIPAKNPQMGILGDSAFSSCDPLTSDVPEFNVGTDSNPYSGISSYGMDTAIAGAGTGTSSTPTPGSDSQAADMSDFNKLKVKLAHKRDVVNPAGLAASIGRHKLGKKEFDKRAAAGRKAHDDDTSYRRPPGEEGPMTKLATKWNPNRPIVARHVPNALGFAHQHGELAESGYRPLHAGYNSKTDQIEHVYEKPKYVQEKSPDPIYPNPDPRRVRNPDDRKTLYQDPAGAHSHDDAISSATPKSSPTLGQRASSVAKGIGTAVHLGRAAHEIYSGIKSAAAKVPAVAEEGAEVAAAAI